MCFQLSSVRRILLPDLSIISMIIQERKGNHYIKIGLQSRDLYCQRKTSFNDTLHAVLAKKSGAQFIITRNLRDFENLEDLAPARFSEEL